METKINKSAAIRRLLRHDPEMPPKVIEETLRSVAGIEVDANLIKVVRRNWRKSDSQMQRLRDGRFAWSIPEHLNG